MEEFFTLTDPGCSLKPPSGGDSSCSIEYLTTGGAWSGGRSNMDTQDIHIFMEQDDTEFSEFTFLVGAEVATTLDIQICCTNVQELESCVAYTMEVTEPTNCQPNVV